MVYYLVKKQCLIASYVQLWFLKVFLREITLCYLKKVQKPPLYNSVCKYLSDFDSFIYHSVLFV